jgi:hypothetical protein
MLVLMATKLNLLSWLVAHRIPLLEAFQIRVPEKLGMEVVWSESIITGLWLELRMEPAVTEIIV